MHAPIEEKEEKEKIFQEKLEEKGQKQEITILLGDSNAKKRTIPESIEYSFYTEEHTQEQVDTAWTKSDKPN